MFCCGDIELNPGPEMSYEYFVKVSEKYKNNLRFVRLNFQDLSKKQIQLKSFVNDMGKTLLLGFLKVDSLPMIKYLHVMWLRKLKLFRRDRSSTNCK